MTKAERAWCDAITSVGCIACIVSAGIYHTPGAVHHLLRGGRRIGHLKTICLCDPGHHQNAPAGSGKISRHPTKARFEQAYGVARKVHREFPRLGALRALAADDQPVDALELRPVDRAERRLIGNEAHARSSGEQLRDVAVCLLLVDDGFEGDGDDYWPAGTADKVEHDPFGYVEEYQGAPVRVHLKDRAGTDPAEWPSDLRVREFPA